MFVAIRAKFVLEQIHVNEFIAIRARIVMIFAALTTNVNSIAISVNRGNNFVSGKVFVALVTKQVFVFEARGANPRTVARFNDLFSWVVFFAEFAKAIVVVEAMFADLNSLTMAVYDFPSF